MPLKTVSKPKDTTPDDEDYDAWSSDLLKRSANARFLERFVIEKFSKSGPRTLSEGICFAIDGDWGSGKSFFVNCWRDELIHHNQHPVVFFDAWKNDLTDEPLVGFMSALSQQLQPWINKLPLAEEIKNKGKAQWGKVVKNAGKAVMPLGKVVGSAILKKYIGAGISELSDALSDGTSASSNNDSSPESTTIKDMAEVANKAAPEFFVELMKDHDSKTKAVEELKDALTGVLTYLVNHAEASIPLFVFVDELDRCRPDYAIRLLEGMKHLFSFPGVCFAVSTNMDQLAESVKAVYGSGFDAHRYLKRFFNFEYTLPTPDHKSFAAGLLTESTLPNRIVSSAIQPTKSDDTSALKIANDLAAISKAFSMDLRSLKQTLLYAEAAAAGIAEKSTIYTFPLFFFSALKQRNATAFDAEAASWEGNAVASPNTFSAAKIKDDVIHYQTNSTIKQGGTTSIAGIYDVYKRASSGNATDHAKNVWNRSERAGYPSRLVDDLAEEVNGKSLPNDKFSIAEYPKLIRAAGQLS